MPPLSQAQRGAMYSAAEGKSNLGIPASVGKEFVASDPGGKLPEHVKRDHIPGKGPYHSELKQLEAIGDMLRDCSTRMDACEAKLRGD